MKTSNPSLGAVVLAAGLSTRMGAPKMLLPWGQKPIIQHVIEVVLSAGIEDIVVVTGGHKERIDPIVDAQPVINVYNPDFANGEMLNSLQVGLRAMSDHVEGAFLVLGDQPTITAEVLTQLSQKFQSLKTERIIIPSFHYRKGHPWIIHRAFWQQIYHLQPPQTLRDFLKTNEHHIDYVGFDTPIILQDLDTPQDYEKYRPQ